MKIDADEKELLESVERGEWKSAAGGSASEHVTLASPRRRSARIGVEHPAVEQRPGGDHRANGEHVVLGVKTDQTGDSASSGWMRGSPVVAGPF
jgi:hypothetical protein